MQPRAWCFRNLLGLNAKEVLSAIFLSFVPFSAVAEISGNQLHEACESSKGGLCFGFIAGAIAGLNFGGVRVAMLDGIDGAQKLEETLHSAIGICPPEGVNNAQAVDVVIKHLQTHPETRHESAIRLIRESLSQTFPCPGE